MKNDLKNHIEYLLCIKITNIQSVSGGDISNAFLLKTDTERFFCKINLDACAFQMFKAEKRGLEAIAETNTIATPRILICETLEKGALLLMEYVEPKRASSKDMELLGHQLAALHQIANSKTVGFESDNFIGSLPQSNHQQQDWSTFYVRERLLPQLKLARESKRMASSEIPTENQLLKTCKGLFPEVKPTLLHGDLWSGNYLISKNGKPYLIDPAVYFGHHEVDIAMTKLFGGFGNSFYGAYRDCFPWYANEMERTDIYQLYYLLVHLNLFGSSYYSSVRSVLKKYFLST